MAHQTGIEPSEELLKLISSALKGSLRFFQVKIEDEALVSGATAEPQGSWEDDLDVLVQPVLEDQSPCYIFYRTDSYNVRQNYLWIFMSYTPDFSPVRLKMLYSATKATVKKSFESAAIVDEIAATSKEELSLAGYRKHEESKNAAPPLTEAEEELKRLHENEDRTAIGTSTRQSHMHGVAFPVDQDAMDALTQFKSGNINYIQLSVDVKKEVVNLETTEGNVDANSLSGLVPDTSPRYHLFCFKHTHEGDYQEAVVFVYSMPGFKSSIKERMLYSSCKEPVVSVVEEQIGKPVDKKWWKQNHSRLPGWW